MAKKRPVRKKKIRYSTDPLYQTAGASYGATTTITTKDGVTTVYKGI